MEEAGRTKKIKLSCDKHPDAQVIEDSRVAEIFCSECRKTLLDSVSDIPENCKVIGNNDGSSSAEPSRYSIVENLFLSSDLTNTFPGPSTTDNVIQCGRIERSDRFDETINAVYDRIKIMAKQLDGNQEVIDFANKILCKRLPLMMKNLKKSWLPDIFAGACLFAGFFKKGIPRTFKEIHSVSNGISFAEISKCYHKIVLDRTFGLSHSQIKVTDLVPRFCEDLDLPKEITEDALNLANQAEKSEITASRLPDSIAATAIYMATQAFSKYQLSMKQVAEVCCVTVHTIRNVYRDMKNISTDNSQT